MKIYLALLMVYVVVIVALMIVNRPKHCKVAINMKAIAFIESCYNPDAFNKSSGAKGLYQITDIVRKDYNRILKENVHSKSLFDASINTMIADWYINHRIPALLAYFKKEDSVENRLIAWNAGIAFVQKNRIREVPKETRAYLERYRRLTDGKA